MNIPTIEAARALDGRRYEDLTNQEKDTLRYFQLNGRNRGVTTAVLTLADPKVLQAAKSKIEADQILAQAGQRVSIRVGAESHPILAPR